MLEGGSVVLLAPQEDIAIFGRDIYWLLVKAFVSALNFVFFVLTRTCLILLSLVGKNKSRD